MSPRPVHDDRRYETEAAEPVLWRKSRRSPATVAAACLEATPAVLRQNGEVAVVRPNLPPFILVQPLTDDQSATQSPVSSDTGPVDSNAEWIRGSLEQNTDSDTDFETESDTYSDATVADQDDEHGVEAVASPYLGKTQGLPGFDEQLKGSSASRGRVSGLVHEGGVTEAEPVRLPMSDGSLEQLVRGMRGWLGAGAEEVAGEGELSAADCVALLVAFTKALYPGDARLIFRLGGDLHGGVAPRRAVDDSVIGTGRDHGRLARGAQWTRVGSWQTLARRVEAAGEGATALVLWQRQNGTGHAFAAHRTAEGVRWLEIGADNGHQVLESAPVQAATHARYVVIDAEGRVVDDGPRAARESESTARAIIDAPLRNDYGKMGPEFETYWLLTSAQQLFHGYRLFGNRFVEMVVEQLNTEAPRTLEFVGGPIAMPGEVGGISEDGFWRSFEYAFHRLRQFTPLHALFGRTDDIRALEYPGTSLGTVEPGKELALSPQWTIGMPPSEMLDWLVKDVRRMSVRSTGTAHADAEAGAALGKLVAARYLADRHGMGLRNPHIAWELLDDPDYRSVGGLVALVFMQAVTSAHATDDQQANKPTQPWRKNYTFAASRHDPAVLQQALSPAARDFLDRNAAGLMEDFSSHASLTLSHGYRRDPMDARLRSVGRFTARDYVNSFLQAWPAHQIAQWTLGITTTFDQPDGDKVLVELRDLADVHDVPEARGQYDALKSDVVTRYTHARHRSAASAAHHGAQRSLLAAINEDQRVGALERILSLTNRFNALHPEKARGFELLDRAAVQGLVGAVVSMAAPGQTMIRPGRRDAATDALDRLDERLVEFGLTLNLFGDPTWNNVKRDWDQGMRDIANLRHVLAGTPISWPPRDITREWVRFSAVPLASRRSLRGVDEAVADVVARPGDETALHAVLDEISTWRDGLHTRSNSSAPRRAPAVRHLERLVLHNLATVAESAPYPMANPGQFAPVHTGIAQASPSWLQQPPSVGWAPAVGGSQLSGQQQFMGQPSGWTQGSSSHAGPSNDQGLLAAPVAARRGGYGAPPVSAADASAVVVPDQGLVTDLARTPDGMSDDMVSKLRSLIVLGEGIERPVSVRAELTRLVGRVFGAAAGPELVERIAAAGGGIVAVARTASIADAARVPEWPEEQRGLFDRASGRVYVAEENILGVGREPASREGVYPDGYSSTVHELAHLLFDKGLTEDQREAVEVAHGAMLAEGRDVSAGHYAASSVEERFAEAVTTYLGSGSAPAHDGLASLLVELYGSDPVPVQGNNVAGALADEQNLTSAHDLDALQRLEAAPVLPETVHEPSIDQVGPSVEVTGVASVTDTQQPQQNVETSVAVGVGVGVGAQGTVHGARVPRFGGLPAGVGWGHARFAHSWGLRPQSGSAVGTLSDALVAASGGSASVDGVVVGESATVPRALREQVDVAEPSAEVFSAAAGHSGRERACSAW
jgi:hypothetical protein